MIRLSAAQAYPRWAASYDQENVITSLDCALADQLTPPIAGARLLDVGCGTGRRLIGLKAVEIVGVEPCAEMLDQGRKTFDFGDDVQLFHADGRAMPLPDAHFDVVWCRLVIGHLEHCEDLLRDISRVAAPDANVIITDFHPEAYTAGLRRSFRDGDEVIDVQHTVHKAAAIAEQAAQFGLTLTETMDGRIGPEVRQFYDEADRLERYEQQLGMPMVSAMRLCKDG